MKTEYDYIRFDLSRDTGKTTIWYIFNKRSNNFLGEIKWYGPWRSYCFCPISHTVFNKGCMTDIIDFIDQLHKERKENDT